MMTCPASPTVTLARMQAAQALDRVNTELQKPGVPFDLKQLKPEQLKSEQLEALVGQLDELTLKVDQPDTTVRVFCE